MGLCFGFRGECTASAPEQQLPCDGYREKIQIGLKAIEGIRAKMQREKERYIAARSKPAFDLADQFAASIEENATLRSGSDNNYSQLRDQYMAEKVQWISNYEKSRGRGKVLQRFPRKSPSAS